MTRVLLTAFEPYGPWTENAAWMLLQHLTQKLPTEPQITTRLYPVEFAALRECLSSDLQNNYDVALLLGQAPGSAQIALESIAINVALPLETKPNEAIPLTDDGPVAYRSSLPLKDWSREIQSLGIPTTISHHAGTYLCNAAFYLAHYLTQQYRLPTQIGFIHVPLTLSQAVKATQETASLPVEVTSRAVQWILESLASNSPTT
jgi:pyroglutamyl-peptidase